MVSQLIDVRGDDPHQRIVFHCPGCKCSHGVPVPPHRLAWGWNGSLDRPTLTPSILVTYGDHTPPDCVAVCHSFVTDGQIQFCGDSTHELAGKTIELEDRY